MAKPFEHETQMVSQQVARMQKGFQYQDCISQMMALLHEDIGGNMFLELATHHHVGLNNIDWVMGYLVHHKIPVLKEDIGGSGYRKLVWTVGTGEPLVETVFSD